jgi:hypothetical protein
MTTEEFAKVVADWLATARHPRFGRPYNELIYQPMIELLGYLRANGFKTFIVSGGGGEFLRRRMEWATVMDMACLDEARCANRRDSVGRLWQID